MENPEFSELILMSALTISFFHGFLPFLCRILISWFLCIDLFIYISTLQPYISGMKQFDIKIFWIPTLANILEASHTYYIYTFLKCLATKYFWKQKNNSCCIKQFDIKLTEFQLWQIYPGEWVSNCCLTPTQQFFS